MTNAEGQKIEWKRVRTLEGDEYRIETTQVKVDGEELPIPPQELAGVEIPAEKAVYRQCGIHNLCHVGTIQETSIQAVAVVKRRVRLVFHQPDLRANPDRTNKVFERPNPFLQDHHLFSARLVGFAEIVFVVDLADAGPGTAVVRFHE